MKVLLDTQLLLWAVYKPERLPSHIMDLLGDTDNQLLVSDASVWEMGIKLAKGKLGYESELTNLLERITGFGITPLSIERRHIEATVQLPPHHRDPFDRILIAQAQVEGLPFVNADAQMSKYDVQVIRQL